MNWWKAWHMSTCACAKCRVSEFWCSTSHKCYSDVHLMPCQQLPADVRNSIYSASASHPLLLLRRLLVCA
jgi:hypothetical protein